MINWQNSFTFLTYKAVYSLQDVKTYLIFRAFDPLMLYLFFAALGAAIIGPDYIQFIVIGNIVFVTARMFVLGLISMFRYEKMVGTLGINIAGTTSTLGLILRRLVIPVLDAIFVISVSFIYAYFLFGISIPLSGVPTLVLFLVGVIISMSAIALIAAALSLVFHNVNLFNNLIIGAMQIFCGVNFSIYLFPEYIQMISLNLPLTNAILGIRQTFDGIPFGESYPFLVKEFVISACIFAVGIILILVMERVAKRTGALFENG